jgi:hypothetical protein
MGERKPRISRVRRRELEEGLRRAQVMLGKLPDQQIVRDVRESRDER